MSNRSVISIHVGQCGVQIGSSVWELYNFEHDVSNDGTRNIPDPSLLGTNIDNFQTFYYETASGKYVPKALFIDSEPGVMDSLRQSALGDVLHKKFMLNSNQDCRNVMGLAWHSIFCGRAFHKQIKNQVRCLREACDSLSGAMYYLSTCGGSGTGFTCRALEEMRIIDRKSVNYAICHTSSPSISGNPLETYNTIGYLGFTRYDNLFMNMHTFYDNEALYRQSNKLYGKAYGPTYKHLNQLIAMSVSSCTASLRFDGQLNVDLNEFQTNLVPIPALNNMFASMAPLDMDEDKELMSTRDITLQAFTPEAYMCSVDPFAFANKWVEEDQEETFGGSPPWAEEADNLKKQLENDKSIVLNPKQWTIYHKFIAACVMYRGDLMPATINRAMQTLTREKSPQFVSWVPAGFKVGINSPPMRTPSYWPVKDMSRSLTTVINNSVIAEKLKQIVRNFRYISDVGQSQGYDVWAGIGGIELDTVEKAKKGIVDQISQYEYCMSSRIDIEEVKLKLQTKFDNLGQF